MIASYVKTVTGFHWIARAGSIPVVLFVFAMLVGHAFDAAEPLTVEGFFVGAVSLGVILSLATAWRWERLGGTLVILAGVALGLLVIFTAGRNQLLVASMLGGPIVALGDGFLVAGRVERAAASNVK